MIWRTLNSPELSAYPDRVEVRPITVGEWRGLERIENEHDRQDWILSNCCRIGGLAVVPQALDVHAAAVIIQGIMQNPWNGQQPTGSNGY